MFNDILIKFSHDISIKDMKSCPIDDHSTMGVSSYNSNLLYFNLNNINIINRLPVQISYASKG